MPRTFWTPDEHAWLTALYPHELAVDVAFALGRPLSSVYQVAAKLGLHKSPALLASDRSGRILRAHQSPRMIATRFQKGRVPANKGLRRPGWFSGRMRETQFKKGALPQTTHPDFYVLGALRINADGYIDIRTSFKRGAMGWTGLHRYLWMQAHGPIPPGHLIRFIDGDRDNVVLGNLEIISMADNARRNYIDKYPIEVRRLVTMKGHITRHVRRIEREAMSA